MYQAKVKIWLIVLIVLISIPAVLIYIGYRQLTKAVEPTNLGVSYAQEDYDSLVSDLGIDIEPEKLCLDCPDLEFTDAHEVEVTISNAQASAAFDLANKSLSAAGISNSQIRFNDGNAELSTTVTYNDRDYPVYMSGNIEKATENSVSGTIDSLKVASFGVPESLQNLAENTLLELANNRIASMGDDVRIDELDITSHGLNFKGLIPTQAD